MDISEGTVTSTFAFSFHGCTSTHFGSIFYGRQKESVQVIISHLSGKGHKQNREQSNGTCLQWIEEISWEVILRANLDFWDVSLSISCFTFCRVLDTLAISYYLLTYPLMDVKDGCSMIRRSLGRDDKLMRMHICGRNLQRILFLLAQTLMGKSSHHHTAKDMHMSLEAVLDTEFSQRW